MEASERSSAVRSLIGQVDANIEKVPGELMADPPLIQRESAGPATE
jgi:hypothetical protein